MPTNGQINALATLTSPTAHAGGLSVFEVEDAVRAAGADEHNVFVDHLPSGEPIITIGVREVAHLLDVARLIHIQRVDAAVDARRGRRGA